MRKILGLLCVVVCFSTLPGAYAQDQPNYVMRRPLVEDQISPFVRRILQDSTGNFWFGTNGDGVVRYDGDSLEYFLVDEGVGGVAVRGIVEDEEANVWFGTSGGITRFDGETFTNFAEQDGLPSNDVWTLFIDSKGIMWIGTLEGLSLFDGESFTSFELPEAEPDHTRGVTSGCGSAQMEGPMSTTGNR